MMNRTLFLSIFVIYFATMTIAQDYTESNLLIDYDEISGNQDLTVETQNILQILLQNVLKEEEIVEIEITAHAKNRNIGERRLESFVHFFEKEGVSFDKLELVTQADDKNRVHIRIYSSLKQHILVNKELEKVSIEKKAVIKKVYCTGVSKKAEVFSIVSSSNIEITGKEGTQININRQDLVYQDGQPVREPIQVELKEFYASKDILLAELHTMEGDKVLETGGMLNLKITAGGKPLELKKGKSANIKMPTKSAKNKKGMHLYFGKVMENGVVDWRLEERSKPVSSVATNEISETNVNTDFNPNSYLQIKKYPVIDSVTTIIIPVNPKSVVTNNHPSYSRERVSYTHEEEYFDLELLYLNPSPTEGVWINADMPVQDPFAPKPIEILVQVNGMPNEGMTIDGFQVSYTPKVALMLKDRAVFLRGDMVANKSFIEQQKIQFNDVPLNEEVVLIAFLDTGKEILFASKVIIAKKNIEMPELNLETISKVEFDAIMTTITN